MCNIETDVIKLRIILNKILDFYIVSTFKIFIIEL
jgi:hypothetical protein